MSEELMQWLAEIRALRQQLTQAERDRDTALESAAHWRKLYNIEARQRRTEARLAQEEQNRLQRELGKLQDGPLLIRGNTIEAEVEGFPELEGIEDVTHLKQMLMTVMQERDRALESLKLEQENHVNTRKSLTAVIGDTIEQLARQRGGKAKSPSSSSAPLDALDKLEQTADKPEIKNKK
ncbi:hypothetical protein K4A83_02010 [Spirulina subsalsa FACHB-351]|uniref:PH domain-containing protein n=1 Tax=Spirulina subsalsa FACHB-351 TaxID=234711 RepID=A0ABT3L1Q0_9CYAN|nr:hypothetical protein [Spirulina subsalsa]MCW6035049.1 hypothetical protein [Spirulina subsalsa FACHB-351]